MTNDSAYARCNAFVFAASGAIAGAVSRELARQGARMFLSGQDARRLAELARAISVETGAEPAVATVDATSASAVADYLDAQAARGVVPDWVFNGIGLDPVGAMYGERSESLPAEVFTQPLTAIVGGQFVTATQSALRMRPYGSGTIVLLTASLAKSAMPFMAGITAACDAVQGLARVLAAEYTPYGPRVLCVRVAGIPETRTIRLTSAANARTRGVTVEEFRRAAGVGTAASMLTLEAAAKKIAALCAPGSAAAAGEPLDVDATAGTVDRAQSAAHGNTRRGDLDTYAGQ